MFGESPAASSWLLTVCKGLSVVESHTEKPPGSFSHTGGITMLTEPRPVPDTEGRRTDVFEEP